MADQCIQDSICVTADDRTVGIIPIVPSSLSRSDRALRSRTLKGQISSLMNVQDEVNLALC